MIQPWDKSIIYTKLNVLKENSLLWTTTCHQVLCVNTGTFQGGILILKFRMDHWRHLVQFSPLEQVNNSWNRNKTFSVINNRLNRNKAIKLNVGLRLKFKSVDTKFKIFKLFYFFKKFWIEISVTSHLIDIAFKFENVQIRVLIEIIEGKLMALIFESINGIQSRLRNDLMLIWYL